MKGDVKKNTSATTGDRDDIQPILRWDAAVFACLQIHSDLPATADFSGRSKQSGCKCQPWFYLRLAAYSFFWLSEGAYGYSRDLVLQAPIQPNAVMDAHPRTRAPGNHRRRRNESATKKLSAGAQAACCFRYSASKRTPFFQTNKVIAAIFRASVSRAIDGFIPRATMAA